MSDELARIAAALDRLSPPPGAAADPLAHPAYVWRGNVLIANAFGAAEAGFHRSLILFDGEHPSGKVGDQEPGHKTNYTSQNNCHEIC